MSATGKGPHRVELLLLPRNWSGCGGVGVGGGGVCVCQSGWNSRQCWSWLCGVMCLKVNEILTLLKMCSCCVVAGIWCL